MGATKNAETRAVSNGVVDRGCGAIDGTDTFVSSGSDIKLEITLIVGANV